MFVQTLLRHAVVLDKGFDGAPAIGGPFNRWIALGYLFWKIGMTPSLWRTKRIQKVVCYGWKRRRRLMVRHGYISHCPFDQS